MDARQRVVYCKGKRRIDLSKENPSKANNLNKTREQDHRLTIITPFYSAKFDSVRSIILKRLSILCMELICAEILKEGVNVVSHQAPTLGRSLSPSFLNRKPIKFLMWLHCKGCYKCGALNALAVNIFWGETNLSPCLIRENLIATPIIVTQALWFTSFHVAPVVPNMGGGGDQTYM